MNWKVPFFDLSLGREEKEAVQSVIDSNWLTAGPKTEEFEKLFAQTVGGNTTAVAVSSATAALHLSLIAMDIGPGDEVILPSLTFVACANVIRYVGATPVFTDITSIDDWNISIADIERKITPKTRAVMPVHYAGYSCDMSSLNKLLEGKNIHILEDCSHAPLAKHFGEPVGTFGSSGCFSFFSNKNLTTGEGGMILTRSTEFANRVRMLRSHGITSSTYQRFKGHAYGYDVAELGFNYRIDEIRSAIGIEQLKKLKLYNQKRNKKVHKYRSMLLEKAPLVKIPFCEHKGDSSYHIFPVLIPGDDKLRNNIIRDLGNAGIQCSVHYRPIHTFTAYENSDAKVPFTDQIGGSIISLPLFPEISDTQISEVVDKLALALKENIDSVKH
ncbi:MAG: DegT/DnrJ/EryC1/StrS aminotransferase family protein [Pseudomonadota bacterium]|nr:DegT/DnrJ/EryC1/StrS aminotransferase family protein [Pseudomonadota bacterium]